MGFLKNADFGCLVLSGLPTLAQTVPLETVYKKCETCLTPTDCRLLQPQRDDSAEKLIWVKC